MHTDHPKPWEKIAAFLFALAALLLVVFPIKDYDTFWHLANGQAMLDQGRIIHEEIFSYSAEGVRFLNHSWLAQIIMALFYRLAGLDGLLLYKLLLTGSLFAVIYAHVRRLQVTPLLAGLAGYAVILVGLSRFVVRPQLFTYLFLALLAYVLLRFVRGDLRWPALAGLPLLMVVWDFMHGAIFGFIFWGALALGESVKLLLRGRPGRWQAPFVVGRDRVLQLWVWLAIAFGLVLIVPYGFERYQVFFVNFLWETSDIISMTGEFMPTDWEPMFRPFWVLLGLAVTALLLNMRRLDLTHLMVLIPFVYLGVRYNRCVAAFAVVAAPLVVQSLWQVWSACKSNPAASKVAWATVLLLCLVPVAWGAKIKGLPLAPGELDPSGFRLGTGLNRAFLPTGMIEFVKSADLQGNMYNNDRWGGFLAFYLYPERRIFHYNHPMVFKDIYEYLHNPASRDQWQHNYALVATAEEYNMYLRMNWVVVYRDAVSMVMVPQTERNRAIIAQYTVRFFSPLLTTERIRQMLGNPGMRGALVREMTNYLRFNDDPRIAGLLAEVSRR